MLNKDALSQLSQLKKDIRATKDIAKGTVRGSNGKFGFASLDDGREAFITPNDMNRLFPGDRVRINVVEGKGGKPQAELEKLLESPLKDFVGHYVVRGQGHFVQPDLPQFNRWLFIPPNQRKGLKAGDFIQCRISQHPFHKDGKAQVKVLERLGDEKTTGIEGLYMASKHMLPGELGKGAQEQADELAASELPSYPNSSELPFVTIDSETTLDMDDAIAVSRDGDGFTLSVAIADPSIEVAPDSALGQAASNRAQTVYLPGQNRHMLPPSLSQNRYSLVAGESRPALLCHIKVDGNGAITSHNFELSNIQSQQKLSYENVSAWLNGAELEVSQEQSDSLKALQELARKRQDYRLANALVMEDKADYDLELNEQGKIAAVHKREKSEAHLMVEEAMLACNICAAEFFAENSINALFSHHAGIKEDKLKTLIEVLQEDHPELAELKLDTLEGYRTLMQTLGEADPQLLLTCKRLLQASQLHIGKAPHLGLGLEAYATITSPIRRYQDYYNHLLLKAAIQNTQAPAPLTEENVERLQEQLMAGRQAVRQMEQWLHVQYMADKIGSEHQATVALVNGQGVGLRFDETGIEGFALLQNKENPWELDHRRLKLVRGDTVYQLGQSLKVKVESIDPAMRRIAVSIV
ncbi:VacB/RNase II family 3'-5' exoribonuclease [Pseudoteredinibacter isoporae]|uniref:exoribonuclease II n=1 Tax=Pseudoteredinibacter isoporae TaxID=570281 RepID=A0A7X0JT60_9GAMM|nr:VacB/RNase II family 3'-5' exoribonuclease [Pseudoteredinibacter isoporae]MBB6521677.1 exoribonuclease-2/ribonuclease R [Pseudoteredinibacter isoporae]NHO87225.1 VacB/RNase II family 3'-5' exoribonuclease [Pseudoteredinibacter isoporae]NIB23143.1 VacB/RNase II family 3'-5' exoribonuclease [Pseudoteredinibacter isoporae]